MSYKLFAIDVDGTLQNSAHKLPEENARAIQKTLASGYHVVLATGKQYSAIASHVEGLDLKDPHITAGGAVITAPPNQEEIYRRGIAYDLARDVVKSADELGITVIAFRDGQTFTREHNPDIDHMLTYGDPYPTFMEDITASFEPLPLQLMCIAYQKEDLYEKAFAHFSQQFATLLGVRKSSPYYIEFTHLEVSKGSALRWLAGHLNIELEEVVAIGDSYNDLSMFEVAGLSVAMGNSPPPVQAAAKIVTDTNDRAGVAKILYELM